MSDTVITSVIGGLFLVIATLVGALFAQGRISRTRREEGARRVDPDASSPLLAADADEDERVRRYEEDPGQFIRDVMEESKVVHAQLREVRRDASLVAKVAYRAIRSLETMSGAHFPITDEELSALERTTPFAR